MKCVAELGKAKEVGGPVEEWYNHVTGAVWDTGNGGRPFEAVSG